MPILDDKKFVYALNILYTTSSILLIYFGYFNNHRPAIVLILFLVFVLIKLIYGIYKLVIVSPKQEISFLWDYILFPASILALGIILSLT